MYTHVSRINYETLTKSSIHFCCGDGFNLAIYVGIHNRMHTMKIDKLNWCTNYALFTV
jgi:hypothetical protein